MNKLAQKKISFIDKLASRLFPLVSLASESKMERRMERRDVVSAARAAINAAINKVKLYVDELKNSTIPENQQNYKKFNTSLNAMQSASNALANDNKVAVSDLAGQINLARDAAKSLNIYYGTLNNEVARLYNLQSAARGVAGEGRAAGRTVDPRAKETSSPKVQAFQVAANLPIQNGILDGLTQQAVNKNPELARKHGLIPDIYPTDDDVFGTSSPTGVQIGSGGFLPPTTPRLPTGTTTGGAIPTGTFEEITPTQAPATPSPTLPGRVEPSILERDKERKKRKEEKNKKTGASRKDKLFSFAADEELKNLQAAINKRYSHYKLPVTGDLDPKTSAAIKDMIRIYKLPQKASYVEVRVHVESPWAQPDKYNPEEP